MSCSRRPCKPAGSAPCTPAPTTRRPTARSNASTRRSRNGYAANPPPAPCATYSTSSTTFRDYYNTVRPHRALDRRTPAQAYTDRPKAIPTGAVINTAHWRVRQDTIDRTGVITLRHNSRLHHIGLGRRHAGTHVLILANDLNVRVIARDTGELLRELQLEPRPGTTNHSPKRERCRGTPVNGVPRHHKGAPGRIRTCATASGGRCSIP